MWVIYNKKINASITIPFFYKMSMKKCRLLAFDCRFGYYQTDFFHEIIVTAQAVSLFESGVKSTVFL